MRYTRTPTRVTCAAASPGEHCTGRLVRRTRAAHSTRHAAKYNARGFARRRITDVREQARAFL